MSPVGVHIVWTQKIWTDWGCFSNLNSHLGALVHCPLLALFPAANWEPRGMCDKAWHHEAKSYPIDHFLINKTVSVCMAGGVQSGPFKSPGWYGATGSLSAGVRVVGFTSCGLSLLVTLSPPSSLHLATRALTHHLLVTGRFQSWPLIILRHITVL